MKLLTAALLLLASVAAADQKPVVESNTRTFYNAAERRSYNPVVLPVNEALATADVENDYDVSVRRFYLMPMLGGEINTVGATFGRAADGSIDGQTQISSVYGAPSFGALFGWRLGAFNVGARYQGAIYNYAELDRLMLNKVYGEIGFNARSGRAIFNGYLDAGWAFATTRSQPLRNGIGAKAGFGVDFLVTRFLTIGPAIEFDVQGYRTSDTNWVGLFGGSGLARIGIQL